MKERIANIIKAAGGEFHALQLVPAIVRYEAGPKYTKKFIVRHPYFLVYFHCSSHGSTLTMRVKGLTVEAVQNHIKVSIDRMYGSW